VKRARRHAAVSVDRLGIHHSSATTTLRAGRIAGRRDQSTSFLALEINPARLACGDGPQSPCAVFLWLMTGRYPQCSRACLQQEKR
jgi:hypothetical protein